MSRPALEPAVRDLVLVRLKELHPEVKQWHEKPKERGRHAGCIFVGHLDNEETLCYYAKQQSFCLRTLFIYHLLAIIGCGPQHFFMLANPGFDRFFLIVVTQGVPGFCMASCKKDAFLSNEAALCLLLLRCCFNIGDIPSNKDNWGVDQEASRLMIVDFSFATLQSAVAISCMTNRHIFMNAWRFLVPVEGEGSDDNDAVLKSFFQVYGQWFATEELFDHLLMRTMDCVIDWVNDSRQNNWKHAQTLGQIFQELELMNHFTRLARNIFRTFLFLLCHSD